MNRAMFSGVAGMKAHQTKMDTIGNNIANVNTYGYKSQRAVFSDIFYQTLRGASAGTGNRGGQNPSTVGYGSNLSGIQSQMTQSSMQNTGFGLDVAITGEGFLQVQDADGNIYYTKAGLLSYDSNGYLTDMNGNFVLGTSADGDPDIQKIKLDDVGSVDASVSSYTKEINGINYTVQTSNTTPKGNVSLNISASASMPIGVKAQAVISAGSINVMLNNRMSFASMDELNQAINDAITEANGGVQHAAGTFTITGEPEPDFGTGLTGQQIAGTNYTYDRGTIDLGNSGIFGGFKMDTVGTGFDPGDAATMSFNLVYDTSTQTFTITAESSENGKIYTAQISKDEMNVAGKVVLTNNDSNTDNFTMTFPGFSTVISQMGTPTFNGGTATTFEDEETFGGFKMGSQGNGGTAVLDLDNAANTIQLQEDPADSTRYQVTMSVMDENGTSVTLTGSFLKGSTSSFTLTSASGERITMNPPSNGNLLASATFDPAGITSAGHDAVKSTPSKDLGLSSSSFTLSGGTEGGVVTLDELSSISIGSDGTISVYHPEKGTVVAGKITLANFANPYGLQQAGNNYYTATVNSGDPQLADPGTDGTGALKSSALEMSNVDLSSEFADMITTQRGFQANSRVITVSDTMLEELINLKR